MDVRKIRRVLQENSSLTLGELSYHAEVSPDDLLPVLREWVSSGRIREIAETPVCGGTCSCSGSVQQLCSVEQNMRYTWRKETQKSAEK
ncbi:MAG: FeoC-like transcriptional regulator [Fibrobacterota bacterium]